MTVRTDQPVAAVAHQSALLAIILLSYFMILLDNSVIFTALPTLQADLELTASQLSWVQDSYTLVFGGLLLLGARAGDLLGRRRVFVLGLVVFSAASLLIGLAPAEWWIIGARALQGIGAAIVAPSSLSLLTASFPAGPERSRAVAWYGATAGIGASLGLVIGGAFAHWISWRAGFFINVPVGVAMIALAPRYLPETTRATGRFDLIGALAATFGVGALVFGVIHTTDTGWSSPVTIGSIALGVALLTILVLNEARAAQPIMPLRLFGSRERTAAYVGRLLFMGAMIGFFYFTTQFLQGVLGWNPLQAGLGFLPMTLVNFVVAITIPRLTRRVGSTIPLVVGIALTLVGMLALSRIDMSSAYLTGVALPMLAIGVGQGLTFAPLTSLGIVGATAADAGAASGLVNTFHQLGSSLGLAVLVAVGVHASAATTGAAAIAQQVGAALATGSAMLAACLLVVLVLVVPVATNRRRGAGEAPATPRLVKELV